MHVTTIDFGFLSVRAFETMIFTCSESQTASRTVHCSKLVPHICLKQVHLLRRRLLPRSTRTADTGRISVSGICGSWVPFSETHRFDLAWDTDDIDQ